MTLLSSLFDKARTFLARKPAASALDAVPAGTLDRLIYDELLEDAPALSNMASEFRRKYAHTDDLVRDVLMQFYQHRPQVRDKTEMDPSRLHNWAVAQGIEESPDTAKAREYTRHDKYAAAMLTVGTASKVRELLERNKEIQENAEAAEQAQRDLDAAAQQVQEAAQDAANAEQSLSDAMGDYVGDGPLTSGQTSAQALCEGATTALQVAITVAEAAQERAEATEFTAQQAAEQARVKLQAAVGEAIAESVAELEQEEELAKAWGVADGEIRGWSYAEREAAMKLLKGSAVSQYAKLLGRWQYAERSLRAKRVISGREEVYAVTRSGRLHDALRSEFVTLAIPELEPQFLDRWSNAQLLSREYRGTEKQGKGAMVLCIDTSDSMNWKKPGQPVTPAVWSKAMLLALLQRARADRRDFVVLLFSSRNQVEVHRFPRGQATLEQMVAVVTRAFNGGTDFEAPLDTAVDILEAEFNQDGAMKGDVIFVTDDDCDVGEEWLERYRERRRLLGFRTWGIAVPKTSAGSTLTSISDNVRAINEFTSAAPMTDLLKAV